MHTEINLDFEKYINKSHKFTNEISDKLNFLNFQINLLNRKRIEQPYLLYYSNIYNYYTDINKFYSKSNKQNEKKNEKEISIKNPQQEKIIRTIKNKKKVYCINNNFQPIKNINNPISNLNKSNLENQIFQNEKNINLEENLKNKKKGLRGSKYRGVSKNGNQWQVLIMINKKKRYIGNYRNEEEAAMFYDIVAIQNHGSKAKTNFYYTPEEIQKIKFMKYLYEGWI